MILANDKLPKTKTNHQFQPWVGTIESPELPYEPVIIDLYLPYSRYSYLLNVNVRISAKKPHGLAI